MRHTSEWQYTHNERVSISDEKPLHMRPQLDCIRVVISRVSISDEKPLHMRLYDNKSPEPNSLVSISDEKPLHMRPFRGQVSYRTHPSFQSQTRSRSTCDTEVRDRSEGKWPVSISDEKPLHMRPKVAYALFWLDKLFQSKTRSRSTCDFSSGAAREDRKAFQSQTRSRSTCDYNIMGNDVQVVSFNLRREAAPHATAQFSAHGLCSYPVSISDEKPLHMRR